MFIWVKKLWVRNMGSEKVNNVYESSDNCDDCGKDFDIPEPDWDSMKDDE